MANEAIPNSPNPDTGGGSEITNADLNPASVVDSILGKGASQSPSPQLEAQAAANSAGTQDPSKPAPVVPVNPPTVKLSDIPDFSGKPVEKEEDIDISKVDTSKMQPNERVNWERVRSKIGKLESSRSTLEKELAQVREQMKTSTATPKEVADLMKERDVLLDKIGQLDLAQDPRFIARFDGPRSSLITQAKAIVKSFGGDDSVVDMVLGMSPKDRTEFLRANMPDAVGSILPTLVQIDTLTEQKNAELSNHVTNRQKLQIQQEQKQQQELKQMKDTLFAAAIEVQAAEGEMFLKPVVGNEKWNAIVDSVKSRIRQYFDSPDPREHAIAYVKASVCDFYKNLYLEEHGKRQETEKQLQARVGVEPRSSANGGNNGQVMVPDSFKSLTPNQAARLVGSVLP